MPSKLKRKPRRPARSRAPSFPRLTPAQIDTILAIATKAPPAPPPAPKPVAASASEPKAIMWHFQHTHPDLPNSILNLCTVAPTIQEARGKAYLLAEAFTQNVIGFLRAGAAPQLPRDAA